MEHYTLHHEGSHEPLCDIRCLGDSYQVMNDATGKAHKLGSGSWSKFGSRVEASHLLHLSDPKEVPSAKFYLNNGDEAEVSEDGHSVAINGRLLSDSERNELERMMQAHVIFTVPVPLPNL